MDQFDAASDISPTTSFRSFFGLVRSSNCQEFGGHAHPTCASLDVGIAGALGRHVANVICQQLQRGDEGFAWKVFGKFAARHCTAIGTHRNRLEKNCGPDRLRQSFYAFQGAQPHGLKDEKVHDFRCKASKIQVAPAVSSQQTWLKDGRWLSGVFSPAAFADKHPALQTCPQSPPPCQVVPHQKSDSQSRRFRAATR